MSVACDHSSLDPWNGEVSLQAYNLSDWNIECSERRNKWSPHQFDLHERVNVKSVFFHTAEEAREVNGVYAVVVLLPRSIWVNRNGTVSKTQTVRHE